MSIHIITESSSDITQELAQKLNITVLPIQLHIGNEDFMDGINLTKNRFYELLIEEDVLPKTSQITPYAYEQATNGDEEYIIITIANELSGCYRNACFIAEGKKNIHVIDSRTASLGQYILVKRACELRDAGKSFQEIITILEEEKNKIHIIALMNTLEYLKKGGRISSVAYAAGALLGIKPVISIEDGKIVVLGKARGSKSGNNMLMEQVHKSGGINFDYPIALGYSGISQSKLDKYIKDSSVLYEGKIDHLPIIQIGPTIGTYAGEDAVVFAWFSK